MNEICHYVIMHRGKRRSSVLKPGIDCCMTNWHEQIGTYWSFKQ